MRLSSSLESSCGTTRIMQVPAASTFSRRESRGQVGPALDRDGLLTGAEQEVRTPRHDEAARIAIGRDAVARPPVGQRQQLAVRPEHADAVVLTGGLRPCQVEVAGSVDTVDVR